MFATQSGATRDLFDAAEALLRRVKGGVGAATVMPMRSSRRSPAYGRFPRRVFSKLAIPEMKPAWL